MTIFNLTLDQQELFAQHLEVFPGVQLGLAYHRERGHYCIVISGMIALVFDSQLDGEIHDFMDYTWRPRDTAFLQSTMLGRYDAWMRRWDPPDQAVPVNTTRADILNIATTSVPPSLPPPPPNRPTIVPGAPGTRGRARHRRPG